MNERVVKLHQLIQENPAITKEKIRPQLKLIKSNLHAADEDAVLVLADCAQIAQGDPKAQWEVMTHLAQALEGLLSQKIPSGTVMTDEDLLQQAIPRFDEICQKISEIQVAPDNRSATRQRIANVCSVGSGAVFSIVLISGFFVSPLIRRIGESLGKKFDERKVNRLIYGKASSPYITNVVRDNVPGHSLRNVSTRALFERFSNTESARRKSANSLALMQTDLGRVAPQASSSSADSVDPES